MKKLKFLALGLAGLMAFASCSKEEGDQESKSGATYKQSQITMGGKASNNPSFYTFDKGAVSTSEANKAPESVVFCFKTQKQIDGENWEKLDPSYVVSGTEADNTAVNAAASETKFAIIKSADADKYEKLTDADFNATKVEFSRKLENGKVAVAFKNATLKCEGFFEIVSFDNEKEDVVMNIWVKE
ncbi:MAG: hypothetical protein J6V74_02975 [Bacteroidales bacterium]|nr:hypothetical protein [Bacteroidales bacterium]